MPDLFNAKSLEERINKIRKEGELATEFTLEYLNCLLKRHDLEVSIPEDLVSEKVPSLIYDTLRQGELPSKEQIMLMDNDTQTNFVIELIWLCGLNAISFYTQETGEEFLDSILSMMDVSEGHAIGCYLICVLTLLQSCVPSIESIAYMTIEFDNSPENTSKMKDLFLELSYALLLRWKEDQIYYYTNTEE